MRSIKRRFELMKYKYPLYSDFMVFAETVDGQGFSRNSVSSWFRRLVPKNDWSGCPTSRLVKHMCKLNEKVLRSGETDPKLNRVKRLRDKTGRLL